MLYFVLAIDKISAGQILDDERVSILHKLSRKGKVSPNLTLSVHRLKKEKPCFLAGIKVNLAKGRGDVDNA